MVQLTPADLQALLDCPKGRGLMVSCYADTSVAEGFHSHWLGHFKTEVRNIKQRLVGDHAVGAEFERNVETIRRTLESLQARQARGMAVFSAAERGFFRSFALDTPVENRLVVHPEPYLVPLLELLCRQREYLAVLTDTHRARLYAASAGGARLLQEIEQAIPKKQHSAGERWGKQQATIARHREDHILHYQKQLAHRVEKVWAEHAFQGILLLGEHEIVEHFRHRLPPRLAAQVVREAPYDWKSRQPEVTDEVRTVLDDSVRAHERQLVDELVSRLEQGRAAAAGPSEVVEALQAGTVAPKGHGYLMLGPDPGETVARCTACRFLSVDMPAACPRCQAPCLEGNLWEEMLLFALRHDLAVHFAPADALPARCRGLAAALVRNDAQEKRTSA